MTAVFLAEFCSSVRVVTQFYYSLLQSIRYGTVNYYYLKTVNYTKITRKLTVLNRSLQVWLTSMAKFILTVFAKTDYYFWTVTTAGS